ncbi:MAG: hypothetical protein Q9177_006266, partial [Variospora cf. flavescens]
LGIGTEIIQHRRHHDRGHLRELQIPAQPDLAGGLKAQEGDWNDVDPLDALANVLEAAFNSAGLDEDGAEEDDGGLDEEGDGEGAPAGSAEVGAEAGEEEGAEDEADEGDEGFGPAVRAAGDIEVGGAEAEEHSVEDGAVE